MKTLAGHNQITGFMKSVGETEAKIAVPEQAAFPTGTINLTADQLVSFSVQGNLSLDPITTPEEISEMRATIKDLFEKRIGENEGAYGELIASTQLSKGANSPQLLNPVNYAPQLYKTRCFANALRMAKQILGDDARFFLDLSILKRAKVGVGTPWHQDAAYSDPRFDYNEVTIWVALQQVKVETGCMRFISGSHKNPVVEHRPVNNDSNSQALECADAVDEAVAVTCPLPAGGCTLHHSGTLHSAGPNTSDVERIAYIMVFGTAPQPAKSLRTYPWLSQRDPSTLVAKRRWMRRGGVFITIWRRLRRGDLSSWRSMTYWIKRAIATIAKGA